ncbi:MAG TPA: HNH endonuclease signature motif containing protein [Gemmatimonadales bacterium]|nr:HNH endonuclease signature motif containing protein [Gemmatimonadales bacterium]
MGGKHAPPEVRFWAKVFKLDGEDACWEWIGCIQKGLPKQGAGYGRIKLADGRQGWAHRLAYQIQNGPLGPGECALHKCDNRRCVRGSHLFKGTKGDNAADMVAKGRQAQGERHSEAVRVGKARKKGLEPIPREEWLASQRGRRRIPASCHPGRVHVAKGLCDACYMKQYRANRLAAVLA